MAELLETLEMNEREGNVDYLMRSFIVPGLTYKSSYALEQALADLGVPRPGEYAPANTNLLCLNRKVQILPNSPDKARVDCEYRPIGESESSFIFSGGTSVAQVQSQVDKFGNQIGLSHTWPGNDPDWPSETHIQGLDLNVLMPQTSLVAVGQLPMSYPDEWSRYWSNAINSTYWAGAETGHWMCTRVDFNPLDVGIGRQRRWKFRMEFEHAETGWVPETWFIDRRTGKPPVGLVPGVGVRKIDWYRWVDFNWFFPNT